MSNAVAPAAHDAHAPHHPALQHHFVTLSQQKEAAVIGMWVFLLTEILFFGGLFVVYMIYRIWYFDAFAQASATLDLFWGGLNTAVLIGSSLTMALAVRAAQTSQRAATVNWLILTMLLGGVFLGVKVIEYADKFEHHHVPGADFVWASHDAAPGAGDHAEPVHAPAPGAKFGDIGTLSDGELQRTTQIYFSLYFTMTGLHALHMIVGIVLMAVITWKAWKGKFDSQYYTPVEMGGLYWHFVDIVWIFLFPLLYLVNRHIS